MWRVLTSNFHIFEVISNRQMKSKQSDKMNKEQSADDPSVDLIRVKICLIAPFLAVTLML